MAIIAPSILSADFSRLGEEIQTVIAAGADWIHLDVMDGHFVPNLTIGPLVIQSLRQLTDLPFDVHLMISQPERYLEDFAAAGANIISVHAEVSPHLHRTLTEIRRLGCQAGVVLNPSTSLEAIEYVLEEVDMVLLMTVNPGFGGQKFIHTVLPKLVKLREVIDKMNLPITIEVDGGVNLDTIKTLAQAGVDIFVAGSAIFGEFDYKARITAMRDLIDRGRAARLSLEC
jgi:ribulose-phosphate 3-epimerase